MGRARCARLCGYYAIKINLATESHGNTRKKSKNKIYNCHGNHGKTHKQKRISSFPRKRDKSVVHRFGRPKVGPEGRIQGGILQSSHTASSNVSNWIPASAGMTAFFSSYFSVVSVDSVAGVLFFIYLFPCISVCFRGYLLFFTFHVPPFTFHISLYITLPTTVIYFNYNELRNNQQSPQK